MVNASSLIGLELAHATAPNISGEVTDILFSLSLEQVVFLLVDVTGPLGTAPVLFAPSVVAREGEALKITAHPDDVLARVDAAIHRTKVPVDLTELPSMFIGPFGNTFSPSMIAALFNARTHDERPQPPQEKDGVWLSELQGHGIRAHVGDVGHLADVTLTDDLLTCTNIAMTSLTGANTLLPPQSVTAERHADHGLGLSIMQGDGA